MPAEGTAAVSAALLAVNAEGNGNGEGAAGVEEGNSETGGEERSVGLLVKLRRAVQVAPLLRLATPLPLWTRAVGTCLRVERGSPQRYME